MSDPYRVHTPDEEEAAFQAWLETAAAASYYRYLATWEERHRKYYEAKRAELQGKREEMRAVWLGGKGRANEV